MDSTTQLNSLSVSTGKDKLSQPNNRLTITEILYFLDESFSVYSKDQCILTSLNPPEYEFVVEAVYNYYEYAKSIGYEFAYDGVSSFWLNDGKGWRLIDKGDLKDSLQIAAATIGLKDNAKCCHFRFRRELLEQFKEDYCLPNLLNELNKEGVKQ